MNASRSATSAVCWVGARPWLPWPLAAWPWWTAPLPAQRLAALRIGVAFVLVLDVTFTYLPNLDDFFLGDGPCGEQVLGWNTQPPRWTWSLLRGLGNPVLLPLVLGGWLFSSIGLACQALTGEAGPRWGVAWLLTSLVLVGGSWSRAAQTEPPSGYFALVPAAMMILAGLAFAIDLGHRSGGGCLDRYRRWRVGGCAAAFGVLTGWGTAFDLGLADPSRWTAVLGPWQNHPALLRVAAGGWLLATCLLLFGWQTRAAALATWALSVSFANINPYIDNAGDVIRGIALFYLMLSPCGAVWSLDHWLTRRQAGDRAERAIVVAAWPVRLLFVQLVIIYFMNGVYKLQGVDWRGGESLYYVLCDVTLTRFAYQEFPVPVGLTRLATWAVLVWEVGFPLWVSLRWTRRLALAFGVVFHLAIFATLELGFFAPYILALYLPLLPWERLCRGSRPEKGGAT
ncbi:MAG: HTTM domain-containing protein [Gemmataceae bacterium]|nr:HTTM domain-containing protein [Gemmataceae bacterium]